MRCARPGGGSDLLHHNCLNDLETRTAGVPDEDKPYVFLGVPLALDPVTPVFYPKKKRGGLPPFFTP
jgi:hypothetical protein